MSKKIFHVLFIFLFSAVTSCATIAQNYTSANKKAIRFFEEGYELGMQHKDDQAIEKLKKAIEEDADFGEPYWVLGQLYEERGEPNTAIEYYNQALKVNKEKFADCYSFIGDIYFKTFKYGEAAENYENYLKYGRIKKEETRLIFEKRLQQCYVADDLMKHPVPFEPHNLGPKINSEFSEYHPSITADGEFLIYTLLAPGDYNSCRTQDGNEEEFLVSRKVNGEWTERTNPGPPLNSDCNEGAANLSPDGHYIFFAAKTREGGYASMDLYFSERTGNTWRQPVPLGPPVNTDSFESQPSFSSDGKTLYFTSNRPGGMGGMDIWVTTRNDDGSWNMPINMGDKINTSGDEISPFIHPDNQTLYFCSNGRMGMGGFDFYFSRKNTTGKFETPENVGYPVNTPYDERSLVISADGKTGYFASTNIEGYGKYDLYIFEMPVNARPQIVNYMKGVIRNSKTQQPVQAEFQLIDLSSGELIVKSVSDQSNGDFLVSIPTNKQYALSVTAEGYLFYSANFDMTGDHAMDKPFLLDIGLQPIEEGIDIIMKNIFFDTDKHDLKPESFIELKKLVELLKKNPGMRIEISGHTDNQGGKTHNQVLSENRAKAVYDFLVANGIPAARLSYKGYGDTKPIAGNDTEEGRAQNRRTEFKVIAVK